MSPTGARTYYVLARARALPNGRTPFRISAAAVGFGIESVATPKVGNTGDATLVILGSQLAEPAVALELVAANGVRRAAHARSARVAGKVFATLNYNAAHQAANRSFVMSGASGPAFARVVILTGLRTCSASELLVNGLRPHAQQVVTIGGTSCGKPYGFSPVEACGNVFSAVNFKAVNAAGQADYETGITPTCAVADDFSGRCGDPAETLTAAALSYLQTGSCPATAAQPQRLRRAGAEPGERRGMTAN